MKECTEVEAKIFILATLCEVHDWLSVSAVHLLSFLSCWVAWMHSVLCDYRFTSLCFRSQLENAEPCALVQVEIFHNWYELLPFSTHSPDIERDTGTWTYPSRIHRTETAVTFILKSIWQQVVLFKHSYCHKNLQVFCAFTLTFHLLNPDSKSFIFQILIWNQRKTAFSNTNTAEIHQN